jgi:glycosyltransferase involved in cell wall biosynthesis
MSSRPLYIDCQVFQSAAWHRGMGKYSMELLKNLLPTIEKDRSATLVFTEYLDIPEEVVQLSSQSKVEIIRLPLKLPVEPREDENIQPTRLANKQILDDAIAQDHDFFILSLYLDEVCSVFPSTATNKSLVYYDSIPYLYHERYGKFKGFFEYFYLPHTATVFEASCLFTISQTVANDLKIFLGIPERKICNIDGAYIPSPDVAEIKPQSLDGVDEFILMPSGQEIRKNNLRAVRAFRSYVNATNSSAKLVVTSFFTDEAIEELTAESGGTALFTGNVSPEEMAWLYKNSKCLLFASEYEGLGLPILEAAQQKKPILCSDIQAFKEISESALFFFDPLDEESIKDSLVSTLGRDVIKSKLPHYAKINKKYTWQRSAQLVGKSLKKDYIVIDAQKPRIAILCPDPSGFSAIGKVAMECHAVFSDYFEIDYYFDAGESHRSVRPNLLMYASSNHSSNRAVDFRESLTEQYDAIVYHIGSSDYHMETIRAALCYPGYAIVHDTHLNAVYDNMEHQGYMSGTRKKLEYLIDSAISSRLDPGEMLQSACMGSIINNQNAIIVHSDFARTAVGQINISDITTARLNLPVSVPIHESDVPVRAKKQRVIALAGIIAGIKGVNLIESVARSPHFEDDTIRIFGFSFHKNEHIERLSLLPNVEIAANPTDFEFQNYMKDVDVLINVRHKHHGETSLTTLEAMRFGVAVAVRDFGWFSELPDGLVCKVAEGVEDVVPVAELCLSMTGKDAKNARIAYMESEFNHDQYAKGISELIERHIRDWSSG